MMYAYFVVYLKINTYFHILRFILKFAKICILYICNLILSLSEYIFAKMINDCCFLNKFKNSKFKSIHRNFCKKCKIAKIFISIQSCFQKIKLVWFGLSTTIFKLNVLKFQVFKHHQVMYVWKKTIESCHQ